MINYQCLKCSTIQVTELEPFTANFKSILKLLIVDLSFTTQMIENLKYTEYVLEYRKYIHSFRFHSVHFFFSFL